MNDLPPTPPERARPRWWLRGLLLLALASTAWLGWREYDYRAAVREAAAVGLWCHRDGPVESIQRNWRAAFYLRTWMTNHRSAGVARGTELAPLRPLLLRLRPRWLSANGCTDTNLDALRGLTSLRWLFLSESPNLRTVDGLAGLTSLRELNLDSCPNLRSLQGLESLSDLRTLRLNDCPSLQNIDALQRLTRLGWLYLRACPALRDTTVLQNLHGLYFLSLSGCPNLQSVDGLNSLFRLKEVHLDNCPQLPGTEVKKIRAVPE